jgi:hypothetical protein
MSKLHQQQSYWSYWVMESKRRVELTVDLLIYNFFAAFICLVAHFFEWKFFLRGILDFVILFLLVCLCILPLLIFWLSCEEEKATEHYNEISNLIEQDENNNLSLNN